MAPVQGNVYVLMGDGGNITVQVGKDGVMLVDTGFAPLAPKAMAEIRKLSERPGSLDRQHARPRRSHRRQCANGQARHDGRIHRAAQNRRAIERAEPHDRPPAGNQPKIPEAEWPNDEYFLPSKDFFFNGEAVVVYHVPCGAHRRR
jgi:hypothetical protein